MGTMMPGTINQLRNKFNMKIKIKKKYYHGTTVANFSQILEDYELKSMEGNCCASDDFHYAKGYATQMERIGIVLMFRMETTMNLKHWIYYWFRRNIARKLIGWNYYLSELYQNNFESWGFVENAMELSIEEDLPLYMVDKIWLVGKI